MTVLAVRSPRRRLVRPVLGFCAHLVLAVLLDPPPAPAAAHPRR
mgnify:CR=1 FL=1